MGDRGVELVATRGPDPFQQGRRWGIVQTWDVVALKKRRMDEFNGEINYIICVYIYIYNDIYTNNGDFNGISSKTEMVICSSQDELVMG